MGNTIWAVGRNYKDHASEMQSAIPKEPLIFIKSMGCLNQNIAIEIPDFTKQLHFELEIAVKLDDNFSPSQVALALDLTARDLQTAAKKNGLPWAMAKSFKNSCPISSWIPYQSDAWFEKINFQLTANQILRQDGKASDMIFKLDDIIKHLKYFFPIQEGDIILTGTPAGVGPLASGDQLEACLNNQIHWQPQVS